MLYVLNGRILKPGKPFAHEGFQYPADWLGKSTQAQKDAIGVKVRQQPPAYSFDSKFYFSYENPRAVEDLKPGLIAEQKAHAGTLLAPSDWKIVRQMETGEQCCAELLAYRAEVRRIANERERLLETAVDHAELELRYKEQLPAWPVLDA